MTMRNRGGLGIGRWRWGSSGERVARSKQPLPHPPADKCFRFLADEAACAPR